MCCATSRPNVSGGEPALNGEMILMALVGNGSDAAADSMGRPPAMLAARKSAKDLVMLRIMARRVIRTCTHKHCRSTTQGRHRFAGNAPTGDIRTYSITSFAMSRRSRLIGTPTAFAVLRLITNSKSSDCKTGRSAGFSPLRTLAVYMPTWRYACVSFVP